MSENLWAALFFVSFAMVVVGSFMAGYCRGRHVELRRRISDLRDFAEKEVLVEKYRAIEKKLREAEGQ